MKVTYWNHNEGHAKFLVCEAARHDESPEALKYKHMCDFSRGGLGRFPL